MNKPPVPIFKSLIGSIVHELPDRAIPAPLPDGVERVPIFIGDSHAPLNCSADAALSYYEHTARLFGEVDIEANRLGGIFMSYFHPAHWFSPWLNWRFRRSSLSPDWRQVDGRLKMVAILAHTSTPVELVTESFGVPPGSLKPQRMNPLEKIN